MAGPALKDVDLPVVQFFVFTGDKRPRARALLSALQARYGIPDVGHVLSAAGTAAAYDLTHVLARAVQRAGSTDRVAIRKALEEVTDHDGAVKPMPRPFTPTRHEALSPEDVFMARFDASGALLRIGR
jgi:branched-chain amino acid transport system substrate-binding protein